MDDSLIDNPFWASLLTRHRAIALRDGDAARYPAQFAPFVGVANAHSDAGDALTRLVGADVGAGVERRENLHRRERAPRVTGARDRRRGENGCSCSRTACV